MKDFRHLQTRRFRSQTIPQFFKLERLVLALTISGRLFTVTCTGAEIPISNPSFEVPALADGAYTLNSISGSGWSGSGGAGQWGVANPYNDWFSGTTDGGLSPNPIDGTNVAFCNNANKLIYENTNTTILPGVAYTLTLLAGHRLRAPFGRGSVSFWAGPEMLAEVLPNPPEDQFIAVSLSYTSPPSGGMIGRPLRIELKTEGTDAQAWFDNLRLFAEPGTVVCTPHRAQATAQLVNGVFVGATITDPGCGYTNPPSIRVEGGGGEGATARALISDGRVTAIQVSNGGCCYTNTPRVIIGSPPFEPVVSISVSRVNVHQRVVLGWRYVLESSTNLVEWTATGPPFVADSESILTEVEVDTIGRRFRLRVVP